MRLSPEEKTLLAQNNSHYLWDKIRDQWTAKDLENLRSGVDMLVGWKKRADRDSESGYRRKIVAEDNHGNTFAFKSVSEAIKVTKIERYIIKDALENGNKIECRYKFYEK